MITLMLAPSAFALAACCDAPSGEHHCCANRDGYRLPVTAPPCCAVNAQLPGQAPLPATTDLVASPTAHVQVAVVVSAVAFAGFFAEDVSPSPPGCNSVLRI